MEKNSQGGGVDFIYGIPLTVYRVYKVNKVWVYPMNRVHHIHNKSVETTPKNSNIFNISFPKRFIRVIKQRVDRTHLYPSQHGLPSSFSYTAYTTYVNIYLKRLH